MSDRGGCLVGCAVTTASICLAIVLLALTIGAVR